MKLKHWAFVAQVTFLVLKLTHRIGWSWWWITAPAWGLVAIWALGLFVAGFILGVVNVIEKRQEEEKK